MVNFTSGFGGQKCINSINLLWYTFLLPGSVCSVCTNATKSQPQLHAMNMNYIVSGKSLNAGMFNCC